MFKPRDLDSLQHKQPLDGFTGVISEVYDYSTGDGEYGPYSYQDVKLSDGVAWATVKLKNHEEVAKDRKGQSVTLLSTVTAKGEKKGLSCEVSNFKGKEKKIIVLTKTGTITFGAGMIQRPSDAAPPQQPQAPTSRPASAATTPNTGFPYDAFTPKTWREAKLAAYKMGKGLQLAARTMVQVRQEMRDTPGMPEMSDREFWFFARLLFIEFHKFQGEAKLQNPMLIPSSPCEWVEAGWGDRNRAPQQAPPPAESPPPVETLDPSDEPPF